jgi:hypothetical protein
MIRKSPSPAPISMLQGAPESGPLYADGIHFYPEAEAVLARLPRRGVPMILQARRDGEKTSSRPWPSCDLHA